MQPLSINDIESELSYAYLHAIAARARVGCKVCSRADDNNGVDAQLTAWGPFVGGGYRTEVDIKVQLKATVATPPQVKQTLSYSLKGISQYNALRDLNVSTPRILVVLFLPDDNGDWLNHTEDSLLLRRCAYWVSLRGAPSSTNETAQTVYLPKAQTFDVAGLESLVVELSKNQIPSYKGPDA